MSKSASSSAALSAPLPTLQDKLLLFHRFIDVFLDDLHNMFPEPSIPNYQISNYILTVNKLQKTNKFLDVVEDFMICVYPYIRNIAKEDSSLFLGNQPIYLLPGVDFLVIWNSNLSEDTQKTIWKYLRNLTKIGKDIAALSKWDLSEMAGAALTKQISPKKAAKSGNEALGMNMFSMLQNMTTTADNQPAAQQGGGMDFSSILSGLGGMMGGQGGGANDNPLSHLMSISKDISQKMNLGDMDPATTNPMEMIQKLLNPETMNAVGKIFEDKVAKGEIDMNKLSSGVSAFQSQMGSNPMFKQIQEQMNNQMGAPKK
jgi:hypothetical protein